MKIIQRGTMKIVPGRMAEAMELMGKHTAASIRLGCPSFKSYRPLIGGEFFHTIVGETEWDSMAAMETFYEKLAEAKI